MYYVHTQAELIIRARGSLHEDNYGASKNIMRQPLFSVTIELIHAASHFGTEPFWHATYTAHRSLKGRGGAWQ